MKYLPILSLVIVMPCWANMSPAGFEQFPQTSVFFETGTWMGDGIFLALRAGYSEIHSLEINAAYVNRARNRFKNRNNIFIHLGDSGKDLWDCIEHIDKQITFWLDGHRGVVDPAGGKNTPLLDELDQIKHHSIKNNLIIIDDMHCCDGPLFDYMSREDIIAKIKEINPHYFIYYVDGGAEGEYPDNIMVAEVVNE
jgi:hypothetical protein